MTRPPSIDDVNRLAPTDFVRRFADIAEHSPWVAETAAKQRPYRDREAMVRAFAAAIDAAGEPERLALLRAHPDLAGRAAIAAAIGADSRNEQAGAGLDRLSPEEFALFAKLNDAYREKFGFPFILAVKGATKEVVLAAFERRIHNRIADEFREAVEQVKRIVRFRLVERVDGGDAGPG